MMTNASTVTPGQARATFVEAAAQLGLAFGIARAKPVVAHLLLGLVDVTGRGVLALAWPGATALVLVLLVGAWAIVTGVIEFAAGFRSGETAGTRALVIAGGLVSVSWSLFGVSIGGLQSEMTISSKLLTERYLHE